MSNALNALLHAYGEASGPPPAPGTPEHAEFLLHRATREALGKLPLPTLPDGLADAVLAAARDAAASSVLAPLRAAYGAGEAPAAGTAAHVEYTILASTRTALEGTPSLAPPAEAVAAVMAAARSFYIGGADNTSAFAPLLAAYGEAEAPQPGTPAHAEYTLLAGTQQAVAAALPVEAPPEGVLAAVRAAARAASSSADATVPFAGLLAAYGEAEAPAPGTPAYAEYVLLAGTQQALAAALPTEAPPEGVLAAVRDAARAATLAPLLAAYGEGDAPAEGAEYALLASMREALEGLPRPTPPADTLAAVRAAAARAVPAAVPAAVPDRAPARRADRGAAPGRRRALPANWPTYATAAFAVFLFVSAGLLQFGRSADSAIEETTLAAAEAPTAPPPAAAAPLVAAPTPDLVADAAPPPATTRDASQPTAAPARVQMPGFTPFAADDAPRTTSAPRATSASRDGMSGAGRAEVAAAPPASPPPPPAPVASSRRPPAVGLAAAETAATGTAGLAGPPATPATWEADTDVRLLSLRLQALREQSEGLAWDAAPAPLGSASSSAGATPGVQAVRAGSAPARVEVFMLPRAGNR
ncbi:MAG TPA: hypothetical protein VK610_08290 [Rhodothermales bacterium]|nr:hypothetical protein [Rhodothermales bacterium]